jgi:hypothetical protein
VITDPGVLLLLVLAGVGAGLTGATAGLASLVSYPALLAAGLPPVAANMTNTVAMLGTTVGAAGGARPELAGQRARIVPLCVVTTVGGAVGGLVLLLTPSDAFTVIVPWLIGGASVVLMAGPRLRGLAEGADHHGLSPATGTAAFAIGIYGGYFGAAAGVLMLALLVSVWSQPLAGRARRLPRLARRVVAGLHRGAAPARDAVADRDRGRRAGARGRPRLAGFHGLKELPARGLRSPRRRGHDRGIGEQETR